MAADHVVRLTGPTGSHCMRSKTGATEGLGTRLLQRAGAGLTTLNKQNRAMDAPASAKVSCLVVSKEVMPHAYSARVQCLQQVYLLQVPSPKKKQNFAIKESYSNSYRLLKSIKNKLAL